MHGEIGSAPVAANLIHSAFGVRLPKTSRWAASGKPRILRAPIASLVQRASTVCGRRRAPSAKYSVSTGTRKNEFA